MEDTLNKFIEELEKNPPEDKNNGYKNLMNDLIEVVKEAKDFEFDDFRNEKYAMPKVELRNKLLKLAQNVVNGRYDN